jgi:hypothetical protein
MRRMSSAVVPALSCALLVAGCAGSTAERCASVDWYRQGYTDGTRTWYSLIDQHNARCAEGGAKPDAARYERGFQDGRWDAEHRFK